MNRTLETSDGEQLPPAGQRGPIEHERRSQIIQAADEHFRRYGYNKTSVADLAKAIGVSSAYVYRFFESKQAIGEAIVGMTLGRLDAALREIAESPQSASQRLRLIFKTLTKLGLELFFAERKLHDICVAATSNHWNAVSTHKAALLQVVQKVVTDGRESGEFERKTPLDETCLAIWETLMPFAHPVLLEQRSPEELELSVVAVTNLVLRSLAP
jgi:AcrR family transcriptional regulator